MSQGSADAVVVGGGVIGCSIAYHLADRGAKVALVEKDALGSQSTGKCAGGVRRQFSSETNVRMQQLSVRLLTNLEAATGVDPEFRHRLVADNLELLLNQLNRLRTSKVDEQRIRQIREGVDLAVQLAEILQRIEQSPTQRAG